MAAVWKIELFKKLSATEAECSKCKKKLQMKDSGTTGLLKHAKTHPEYAVKIALIEEQAAAEKNSMDKFVKVMPTGTFLLLFSILTCYTCSRAWVNSPRSTRRSCTYLSAPATSVASEQLFSVAGDVYDDKRSKLSSEKAEMLVFLNKSLPPIEYCY